MIAERLKITAIFGFLMLAMPFAAAQKSEWRQASDSELASVLPSRASVESEHIETEMRTASGIVDDRGRFIAGVVLLTAGYSADGKYSHYLLLQVPVHFNVAATGTLVGTADARRIAGSSRVESLHIWPPEEKALIQIGRFGIPYKLGSN
jgi:hypothetical protein